MFLTHSESTLIARLLPVVADYLADQIASCMADGDFSIPVPVWAENLPELADRFALGWSDYMYDDLPGYIRLLSTEQKWELCHAIDDRLISSNYEP